MRDYLNTREVAAYLKLNEKKIYALVASGQLPAARISGKWLFPRDVIDQWVEDHTVYPAAGMMGAVLDKLVVMQGSDDWLLSGAVDALAARNPADFPVVEARIGSLAGLSAIDQGRAHVAGCHVSSPEVNATLARQGGGYLLKLFSRSQGLFFDGSRTPDLAGIGGMEDVLRRGLRFADRQERSGTWQLGRRLPAKVGAVPGVSGTPALVSVGPFATHLEAALAVRSGRADVGLGARAAAELCGLDFLPIEDEDFKLVVPLAYASRPHMARFLDATLDSLRVRASEGAAGYDFTELGSLDPVPPKKEAKEGRKG